MPSSGDVSGGTVCTVTGSNLGNGDDITSVIVGGTAVSLIGAQTTNSVIIATPEHVEGVTDVIVRSTSYGQSVFVDAFTYVPRMLNLLP